MRKVIFIVLLLIAISLYFCTYAEITYKYKRAMVTLSGKLTTKMFYGPSNYGGNPKEDEKEVEYILVLEHPITVVADKKGEVNETHSGEKEIQIVNLTGKTLKQFLGQKIKISGSLFSTITGHHHTNVLITLKKINDINEI